MKYKFLQNMKVFITYSILIIWTIFFSQEAAAQIYSSSQNISGTINTYTAVSAVSACGVTVASTSGLAIGNKVLIIQMKGADISLVNDATFGDISAINSAGNYEFATITAISGTTVSFGKNLIRTYDPAAGVVQLITVPQYNGGVTISGTVTPQSWNGTTGGVVVFEASTLLLNADIDATARGFLPGLSEGGALSSGDPTYRSPDNGMYNTGTGSLLLGCTRTTWSSDPARWATVCGGTWRAVGNTGCGCMVLAPECINPYVTDPLNYTTAQQFSCIGRIFSATTTVNAEKGESIHVKQSWYNRGRGKIANAGGGGNMHNGGGGGGSNYGSGGIGGRGLSNGGSTTNTNGQDLAQGIGGAALSSHYPSKIFLGGGGGSGQGNNLVAIPGANGGGIVIIKATTLQNPSGNKIMANGEDNYRVAPGVGGHDGAGGGGGGGVVLLNITTYSNTVTVEAKGGKGADNLFVPGGGADDDCYGPGGGGGGGAIQFSQGSTPGGVTTAIAGGVAGVQVNPSTCAGAFTVSFGALAGSAGAVLYNLALTEGSVNCGLPVEMISFHASLSDNRVRLDWTTASEKNNGRFEILRSSDGQLWQVIGTMDGKGNTSQVLSYLFYDNNPPKGPIYYKIRQVDYDGSSHDSNIEVVRENFQEDFGVYPNPLDEASTLNISYYAQEDGDLIIEIADLPGQVILKKSYKAIGGLNEIKLELNSLSHGCYVLTLISKKKKSSKIIAVY
jgi:hypothetical protein